MESTSLTFFENELSHAIRKPAGFRNSDSQKRVAIEADDLPTHMLNFANYIVISFWELYRAENIIRMRVDLFDEEGIPVLCELEVVEPNTNIGVVARSRESTIVNAIFESYAIAIDKQVRKLLTL